MAIVNAFEVAPVTSTTKTATLIHFVLDETGSMNWITDSTISSFNEYVGSQKTVNDGLKTLVSLTKFSDTGGVRLYRRSADNDPSRGRSVRTVFDRTDIQAVPQLSRNTYTPNGGTNLYDAIGETIAHLDRTVTDAENVLVVIMTDGEENCSREYNAASVKKLVEERQAKGWTFVYLGANQDAWKVGSTFGLSKGQTMSYSTADMSGTMANLSMATTAYRSARSVGAADSKSGLTDHNFFGEESK